MTKEVKTFEFPGVVVRVHIPDLTEAERSQRLKALKKAAERFIKAVTA